MNEPLAVYSFRRSVLEQNRSYSLYPDRLVIEGADIAPQTYLLSDVQAVQLKYEHTKQREYYQCYLRMKGGRIVLRHVDWSGFGNFTDLRASYTPFVKALLAQLARYPGVKYRAGSMLNFGCAIAGIPLLGTLSSLAVQIGHIGTAIFGALMMGLCAIMIGPSRPRPLDPLAPPEALLP